ncbi:hypothetical protein [Nocardiopsis aegyptia]|uniref:Uncharacterized protein n=1 Tax=Nocardiopsis aegyptia TaxID=220378 RepID=A0A7Z0ELN9_9ACTN|nr:hypothetical protein [Nocardiopsis aegyptia]NYJ34179.1 hypothetical protein [Nocardiopsis aegyptia]
MWALIGAASAPAVTVIDYVGIRAAGLAQTFVVLFLALFGAMPAFGSGANGSAGHFGQRRSG